MLVQLALPQRYARLLEPAGREERRKQPLHAMAGTGIDSEILPPVPGSYQAYLAGL